MVGAHPGEPSDGDGPDQGPRACNSTKRSLTQVGTSVIVGDHGGDRHNPVSSIRLPSLYPLDRGKLLVTARDRGHVMLQEICGLMEVPRFHLMTAAVTAAGQQC